MINNVILQGEINSLKFGTLDNPNNNEFSMKNPYYELEYANFSLKNIRYITDTPKICYIYASVFNYKLVNKLKNIQNEINAQVIINGVLQNYKKKEGGFALSIKVNDLSVISKKSVKVLKTAEISKSDDEDEGNIKW